MSEHEEADHPPLRAEEGRRCEVNLSRQLSHIDDFMFQA
jgi:hypothetical protein